MRPRFVPLRHLRARLMSCSLKSAPPRQIPAQASAPASSLQSSSMYLSCSGSRCCSAHTRRCSFHRRRSMALSLRSHRDSLSCHNISHGAVTPEGDCIPYLSCSIRRTPHFPKSCLCNSPGSPALPRNIVHCPSRKNRIHSRRTLQCCCRGYRSKQIRQGRSSSVL